MGGLVNILHGSLKLFIGVNDLSSVFLQEDSEVIQIPEKLLLRCAKPWLSQAIIDAYIQSETFYREKTFDASFVLIDYSQKRTIAYRDFFGLTPLFYADAVNQHLFSFSIHAIVASRKIIVRVNYRHLADYLNIKKKTDIIDNQTFFEGVYRLLPNYVLLLEEGQAARIFPAKPLDIEKYKGVDDATFVRLFDDIFVASVKRVIQPFSRLGLFLSGGLDSSSVLGVLNAVSAKPLYSSHYNIDSEPAAEQEFVDMAIEKSTGIHKNVKPALNVYEISEAIIKQIGVPESILVPSSMQARSIDFFQENGIDVILTGRAGDMVVGPRMAYLDELYEKKKWKELREAMCQYITIRRDWYQNQSQQYKSKDKERFYWFTTDIDKSVTKFAAHFMLSKAKQNLSKGKVIETLWVLNRYFDFWGKEVFETLFMILKRKKKNQDAIYCVKNTLWQKARKEDTLVLDTSKLSSKPLSIFQKRMIDSFYVAGSVKTSEANYNYLQSKSIRQEDLFYDTELLELTLNAPLKLQFGKGMLKGTLREAMKNYLPEGIHNRVSKGIYGEYGKLAFKTMYETFKEKEAYRNDNHAIWELIDKGSFDKLAAKVLLGTANFDHMLIATRVIYTTIWLDYVVSLEY